MRVKNENRLARDLEPLLLLRAVHLDKPNELLEHQRDKCVLLVPEKNFRENLNETSA